MGVLAETAEDLAAAFDALRQAGGREPDHRRALKAVLNELYLVRAFREGRETNNRPVNRPAYLERVAATDAGKVTQGIVFLRGVITHHLIRRVEPVRQPAYPGPHFVLGPHTFLGSNFCWISTAEIDAQHTVPARQLAQYEHYRDHVAEQMMLPTLDVTIRFLLEDPDIIELEYV